MTGSWREESKSTNRSTSCFLICGHGWWGINTPFLTPTRPLRSGPLPLWATSMSTSTNISPLRNLVNILSDAVTKVDQKYASAKLEFPALDRPFREEDPAWCLLSSPDVASLASIIVAAADQLIASARPPVQTILDMSQAVCATYCGPGRSWQPILSLAVIVFHFCVLGIGLWSQRCRDLARGRTTG